MAGLTWTDEENELTVAAYFVMLTDEISGRSLNKSARRRELLPLLDGRNGGAVEFKHQNISAVLKGLGQPWVQGYKPAFNFQKSLEDAVVQWLSRNPGWLDHAAEHNSFKALQERPRLWLAQPPTLSNQPPPAELEQMQAIARKFDVAGNDERNRALGHAGEQLVLAHERATLTSAGHHDLADKVRWVSQEDGDGAGYDIASFTPNGKPRLIEVKTTNGWERTPFHISRNELAVAEERAADWCLFRLWDFARAPKAFELYPPLETHVSLIPTSFQASFH
jgi:hypothetical protein